MTIHNTYNLREALLELRSEAGNHIQEDLISHVCEIISGNVGPSTVYNTVCWLGILLEYCVVNKVGPPRKWRPPTGEALADAVLLQHDTERVIRECFRLGFDPLSVVGHRIEALRENTPYWDPVRLGYRHMRDPGAEADHVAVLLSNHRAHLCRIENVHPVTETSV